MFLAIGLSYRLEFFRHYLQYVIYFLVTMNIVWVNHMLYINRLNPMYALNMFILFLGLSLIIENKKHLIIYLAFFMATALMTAWSIQEPLFSKVAFSAEIFFICILDYIAINNFISSRKELSVSNENFKTLTDNADASLILLDKNLRILKTNDRAIKKFKLYRGKELRLGSHIKEYIPEKVVGELLKSFKKVLSGKLVDVQRKVNLLPGKNLWLEVKCIPVLGSKWQVQYVIFIVRNIDKIKRSEETILRKNLQLEKINEELDKFVYRSAHDLRAPLTSILGLIHLCEIDKDPHNVDKNLQFMRKSVIKLDDFIKDILNYSRNSRADIEVECIDFNEVINSVFETHEVLDPESKINKYAKIEHKINFYLDPHRLEIIFNNLISNAIKYHDLGKEKPFIKVNVKDLGAQVKITVEDNGQGIHDSQIDKIFDIFYRGNESSKGSGLCLYLVKEIVQKLNGSVEVKSHIGKGSIFSIILPNQKTNPRPTETRVQSSIGNLNISDN